MPKDVDPFAKKQENRWGSKESRSKKGAAVKTPQEKAIERAMEIAKKKSQK